MKRSVGKADHERREAEKRHREWVADPEEQILYALAQIRVVDGLLFAEANEDGSSPIGLKGMAAAACRLTQASLETFERLNVVGHFLKGL